MDLKTYKESSPNLITMQYLNSVPLGTFAWQSCSKDELQKTTVFQNQKQICSLHFSSNHQTWDEECQETLLNETVLHPCGVKFPISQIYQKQFLKFLIDKVESAGMLCCETIYSMYVYLLNLSVQESAYKSYYLPDLQDFITLQENINTLSCGTTGLVTWKGGLFLAEWCLVKKHLLKGCDVLELGSGCGVTGIAVAKCVEVKSYTFTDFHENVLSQLACNVKLNNLDPEKFRVKQLDWESDKCDVRTDVVLAADVVFDPALVPSLARTISHLLSSHECVAYVACTVRNMETYQYFIKELELNDLQWKVLQTNDVENIFFFDRNLDFKMLQIKKSKDVRRGQEAS